jgi:hypothetical protein
LTTVHAPPNTIERIETIWAVLSVDANGEGICGSRIGGSWMTLTVSDEKLVEKVLMPIARKLSADTGKKLRLVKFTMREEIMEITPP